MYVYIKQAIRNTFFLRVTAILIGFTIWSVISNAITTHTWVTIPLCFYNDAGYQIEAPATIQVKLCAKRKYLKFLDHKKLAAHIDASYLKPGPNGLEITESVILLPSTITIESVLPANVQVTVTPKAQT